MMAVAHPKLGLRPYLPADAPLLREIFRDSIEALTDDDYTEAQQEAWASVADDEAEFSKKLAGQLTLVATLGGLVRRGIVVGQLADAVADFVPILLRERGQANGPPLSERIPVAVEQDRA